MFCNKCGQRIADDSRFCKFCGSSQEEDAQPRGTPGQVAENPPQRKDKSLKWLIGGGVAVVLLTLTAIVGNAPSSGPTSVTSNASITEGGSNSSDALASAASQPANNWSYSTDTDQVRGGTTYYATTSSTNSIRQDFPYSSDTTMTLTVRKSPAYGSDVMLQISSGQMMCPSYEGCSGTVRFDNGTPETVALNGPADSSSDVVFVRNAKSFITKLKKAKTVVVEKTLYQAGAPQFEFNVAGLKWDH